MAITRREFEQILLGVAASALLPASSCGDSYDGTVAKSGNQVTLTYAQFPKLAQTGGAAIVDVSGSFPIAVARTGDATAAALSATCTHEPCIIGWNAARNDFRCPCHGAEFTLDGQVVRGPTDVPLVTFKATVAADAIVVDLG